MCVCLLLAALPVLAGCGQASRGTPRVPAGAVAVVGTTPITSASVTHWRAILVRDEPRAGRTNVPVHTFERALSFLIKAQWLQQEARAEGLDLPASNGTTAGRVAGPAHAGASDAELQARLDAIASALARRHAEHVPPPTRAEVVAYYRAHRSQFTEPAVRHTLMVVTGTHSGALAARTALQHGASWAAVARRLSTDPSASSGGNFNVLRGVQSATLTDAVFAATPGRITGPVRAPRAAEPSTRDYYLFDVMGEQKSSVEPLPRVEGQIRSILSERMRENALNAFVREYEQRWRARTVCAAGYVVPECRR